METPSLMRLRRFLPAVFFRSSAYDNFLHHKEMVDGEAISTESNGILFSLQLSILEKIDIEKMLVCAKGFSKVHLTWVEAYFQSIS